MERCCEMAALAREDACELDANDPLRSFRDRFIIADDQQIYLDGNSLGRLPKTTRAKLIEVVDQWGSELVTGWSEWVDWPSRIGDLLGQKLLGASAGEVVITDTTTVNIYKLCAAVLESQKLSAGRAILTDRREFPTDRYVVEGLATQHNLELRLLDGDPVMGPTAAEIEELCEDGGVALIVLSHVHYRSGAILDMAEINQIARRHDATVVWDLSHSAGSVPVDLDGTQTELAVGCTYKYLNSGPGAPAFLYIAHERLARLASPIWGWFGQRDQFKFGDRYDPDPTVRRFFTGTPNVLGLSAVSEGVSIAVEAGAQAVRAKSIKLTALLVDLYEQQLEPLGFSLVSPTDPALRGSHIALQHESARQISQFLRERCGVVVDFREPNCIRFGVAALYTRFVDVWDGVERVRSAVQSGEFRDVETQSARVP